MAIRTLLYLKINYIYQKMFEIKIPFKTPTINHLYWHKGNIKIMKTEAKKLREEIKKIVWNTPIDPIREPPVKLKIKVEIHEDWFTKDGKVKRKDVANREKFLVDSVFEALGVDDKYIFEHNIIKHQDFKEFSIIKIEEFR